MSILEVFPIDFQAFPTLVRGSICLISTLCNLLKSTVCFRIWFILFNVPCIVENNVILLLLGSVFCICWQGQVCHVIQSFFILTDLLSDCSISCWKMYLKSSTIVLDLFFLIVLCFFLCMFQVLVLGAYRFLIIRYSCWIEFLPLWIEFLPLWNVSLYLYEYFLP